MTVEQQNQIWESHWDADSQLNINALLYSKHTKDAYAYISRLINKKDKLILEPGCGTGRLCCLLAKDFSESQVTGMDASESSLKIANSLKSHIGTANVNFEAGNLFKMKYPDNYFDVVLNEGVIEHFAIEESPNYVDAVREMVRVTKPGGKVIIGVPNWYCFAHTVYKWILNKIGKSYKYGYEKSFKPREMVRLYKELKLTNIETAIFNPAYEFDMAAARGGVWRIFWLMGRFVNFVELLDFSKGKKFTRQFGIEIVIRGTKPF